MCFKNRWFCDSYCRCECQPGNQLPRSRFRPICDCYGGCENKQCPCFAASYECHPDLCNKCGVSVHPRSFPAVEKYVDSQPKGGSPKAKQSFQVIYLMSPS